MQTRNSTVLAGKKADGQGRIIGSGCTMLPADRWHRFPQMPFFPVQTGKFRTLLRIFLNKLRGSGVLEKTDTVPDGKMSGAVKAASGTAQRQDASVSLTIFGESIKSVPGKQDSSSRSGFRRTAFIMNAAAR